MTANGHITRLVINRGFGFIQESGGADELVFHWTAVVAGTLEQLKVGQLVEFEKQVDHREEGKSLAVDVRLVSGGDA